METFRCPNCGGQIQKDNGDIYFCPYCGCILPAPGGKQKLEVNIQTDEKKTIVHEKKITHKNRAKELEQLATVIFFIILLIAAIYKIVTGRTL